MSRKYKFPNKEGLYYVNFTTVNCLPAGRQGLILFKGRILLRHHRKSGVLQKGKRFRNLLLVHHAKSRALNHECQRIKSGKGAGRTERIYGKEVIKHHKRSHAGEQERWERITGN
jgi:hypothetical protein